MRRFFAKLANLFRGRSAERELAREIDSHLAMLQEEFERRGLSPEEAKLAARRAYGGVEQAKELHREARSFLWIEQWLKDVRYGARNLLRTPGFTSHCGDHAGIGHRREYRDFQRGECRIASPAGVQGSGPPGHPSAQRHRSRSRSPTTSTGATRAVPSKRWRRRNTGAPNLTGSDPPEHLTGLARDAEPAADARHRAVAGPPVRRGRRPERRGARGRF